MPIISSNAILVPITDSVRVAEGTGASLMPAFA